MDNRRAVCMVMLDLSAAFDTLDHNIMLERLSNTQGLGPCITGWFESYLRGRTQRVSVDEATSDHLHLLEGAVQGSKMGCRLYTKSMSNPQGTCFSIQTVITMDTPTTIPYGSK